MSGLADVQSEAFFDLQLFVAGGSGRARSVERDVRRVLEQEFPGCHDLTVIDVIAEPEQAERANISLTPTLIYNDADTPRRLVGAVHRREQIAWLVDRSPSKPAPKSKAPNGALSDLCPDGIILVDDDGRVVASNKAGRTLLGLTGKSSVDEVFGLPPTEGTTVNVVFANGLPVELRVTESVWNGQKAYLAMLRDQSGEEAKELDTSWVEQSDPDGLAEENAALKRAIAKASREIAVLQGTMRDLERSNSDLSAFPQRTAHDVKSPALTIRGLLDVLIEDEADKVSDDGRAMLEAAQATSNRLIGLTDALLAFSTATGAEDQYEAVDLNAILKWVQSDLETEIQTARATFEIGDLPIVPGAPMQLYQVFLNLISNALKYRRETVAPHVKIIGSVLDQSPIGAASRIEIRDNGVGFDNAYADRIFKPFERLVTYSEVPGHGIGLTTVKRVVERHGGQVSATGFPGKGATFCIDLPRHQTS